MIRTLTHRSEKINPRATPVISNSCRHPGKAEGHPIQTEETTQFTRISPALILTGSALQFKAIPSGFTTQT
jgi:hypothetical protein